MRMVKGLSQEDMAEKLGVSTNGYGKIERGETDINISRLEQVAKILEVDLRDIFNFDGKIIFNYSYSSTTFNDNSNQYNSVNFFELERAHLLIEQKDKEITLLREQIVQLQEIIALMKAK